MLGEQRFSNWHMKGVFPGKARATMDFELSIGRLACKCGERKGFKRQVT